ncbi:CU044_5270 family protein [Actinomadura montaniterrae]|nr:CU044_5270 family protein [Actinomadura montaniterrae]
MDELQMIATMLDEPPAPDAEAAVRRRLMDGMREPERAARRAWRRPALWSGLGLAATAAAVTGALTLTSGTAPRAPDPGPGAVRPMSAKTVLLTAAEHAEAAPSTGTYWHVRTLTSIPFHGGPRKGGYWGSRLTVGETWTLRDGRSWTGYREAGVRIAPKDEAAWKRDGSPNKAASGHGLFKDKGPGTFLVCDKEMSFTQVQALPAEPAGLLSALKRAMLHNDDGPVPPSAQRTFVAGCLAGLLADVPVAPKVRAAAYRALAATPGVTVTGRTTDERGRTGIGLVVPEGRGGSSTMIIDPDSSLVLSTTVGHGSGGKDVARIILEAGWTDASPKVPALP